MLISDNTLVTKSYFLIEMFTKNSFRYMDTSPCFFTILTEGNNFCDFLFASPEAELQIRGCTEDNSRYFFLFLNKNVCCDPSLELSREDGSNGGSQNMFFMENYP